MERSQSRLYSPISGSYSMMAQKGSLLTNDDDDVKCCWRGWWGCRAHILSLNPEFGVFFTYIHVMHLVGLQLLLTDQVC
jgi:hypothetical protein